MFNFTANSPWPIITTQPKSTNTININNKLIITSRVVFTATKLLQRLKTTSNFVYIAYHEDMGETFGYYFSRGKIKILPGTLAICVQIDRLR